MAFRGEHEVGRLDVAVNYAFVMGGLKTGAGLDGDLEGVFERERADFDLLLNAWPLDELHRNEAMFFVDFVDGTDIGVIERCRGLGFTEEALTVFGGLGRQELQGYRTLQLDVLGLVHHAHPALAEFREDPVVGNGLADHGLGTTVSGGSYR